MNSLSAAFHEVEYCGQIVIVPLEHKEAALMYNVQ